MISAVLACAVSLTCPAQGLADDDMEKDQLRAAFLFNFLKLTAFAPPLAGSTDVCVATHEAPSEGLSVLDGKSFEGGSVHLRFLTDWNLADGCRLLFILTPTSNNEAAKLGALTARGVLTVGEEESFLEHGGGIRLFEENNRLRFEIARTRLEASGFRLSSKVLNLATIYEEP